MDYLYQLALEPADNPLLPEGKAPAIVCQSVHNLNAEVAEHDAEVTATIDMIRGAGASKISVELFNENTLTITCHREEEEPGDNYGNCLREQRSFSLHRVIPLPCRVIPAGAKMSLKNGVLDIRLKKVQP
jgi:HSP20 family molecular chaperone IbpA